MVPRVVGLLLLTSLLGLAGCAGGAGTQPPTSKQAQITVAIAGSGTVTSTPSGINCPGTCTANFTPGTPVTLAATAASGFQFAGFGGACGGQTCELVLSGNQSVAATFNASAAQVSVLISGNGTVTSNPAGINCPATCSADFNSGSSVTLTATPASGSTFAGFSGACTGATCQLTPSAGQTAAVTATFATAGQKQDISAINHIIVMLQENRSFDEYFGHLPDYWKANGFPQASNGTTFDGEPSSASNVDDTGATVNAYKISTACTENPSPSWDEDHVDRNRNDSTSPNTATMDGFVHTAGKDAVGFGFYDVLGHRAMGYFTGDQLNYYYFMASSFATSDRWFSPVMSRTQPNRMYLYAATSEGHVYPLAPGSPQLTSRTIFQLLQNQGISWKIYAHPDKNGCSTPSCLYAQSYLNQFAYGQYVINHMPSQFAPISQLLSDMRNGTLPQVAFVEPASETALDEHSSDDDVTNPPNVQSGAAYVANIINTLMTSPSWKDSVFILSYDEFGGFYDHVPPHSATPPDAIEYPTDLQSNSRGTDICYGNTSNPVCGFFFTGFRVPLIVISPFTKKNYVSHTTADYTAILKFIETRFGLPSLSSRDAAQPDMTEFFDFGNAPWKTPPTPPAQARNLACVLESLSAVTVAPNPAPAGAPATVTLSLSKGAIQPTTVYLSSNPPVSSLPSSVSIATGASSASFNITVPSGTSSLTITGYIGGIPVSTTVPVQ